MEGKKIWNNILSGVRSQVSHSTFKTWFSGSYVLDFKEDTENPTLIVALKNSFLKEQVEARYKPVIKKIIDKLPRPERSRYSSLSLHERADTPELGSMYSLSRIHPQTVNPQRSASEYKNGTRRLEIIFVVAPKLDDKKPKAEPIFSGIPQAYYANGPKPEILNPDYNFDNFVVGPSNNLAYTAAKQASSLSSTYNPLLIYGATGVGKTHLLQAIGNLLLTTFADAKIIYSSSEKFTNEYIESLKEKTQTQFRNKYRTADLLLIDDIQFLAGKESTQDEFFYTFNELSLLKKQIVLVSDKHPSGLGKIKERLISRFLGGMCVDIGLPDIEMRKAMIEVKCQARGVSLPEEISRFIAESCPGGARELEGLLISALSLSRLSGGKISLDDVKKVSSNFANSKEAILPENVARAVCEHFKIPASDLAGPSRKADIVLARQILIYLLRKDLGLPLVRIGVLVGGRDHSTVIHSVEKLEKQIDTDRRLKDEILRIRSAF